MPKSPVLEKLAIPQPERIYQEIKSLLK